MADNSFEEFEKVTETAEEKQDVMNNSAVVSKAFQNMLEANPKYDEIRKSRSNDLEVVKVLNYGDKGNIVNGKATGKSNEKGKAIMEKIPTGKNVGYTVKNVGKEKITVDTVIFTKNSDGVYVGTKKKVDLAPGKEMHLTREYFARLVSRAEFGSSFKNGTLLKSSARLSKEQLQSKTKAEILKFELESMYAKLNTGTNDDTIKTKIAKEVKSGDGKSAWQVLPEFIDTFGYLNNPKVRARKATSSTGEKYSHAEKQANYLAQLIREVEANN